MKQLKIIFLAITLSASMATFAQGKIFTRSGSINFFSKTTVEDIDATNNEVFSIIDEAKGEVAFQVLVTGFKFKKALMQDHFNDEYMESAKFPKAMFKGTITDLSKVDFNKDGTYRVTVDGTLSMHGVDNKISVPATIHIVNKKVGAETKFIAKLADYKIKIPSVVSDQVSETIEIRVNCQYDPYGK